MHDTVTERGREGERGEAERIVYTIDVSATDEAKPNPTTQRRRRKKRSSSISGEMKSASNIISHPDRCCLSSAKHLPSGAQVVVRSLAQIFIEGASAPREKRNPQNNLLCDY